MQPWSQSPTPSNQSVNYTSVNFHPAHCSACMIAGQWLCPSLGLQDPIHLAL